MRKSRLSWSKQEKLVEHFVAGTTARCAGRLIGVHRNTATYYYHRLRELIAHHQEQEALSAFERVRLKLMRVILGEQEKGIVAGVLEEKHQYLAC